MAPLVRRNFAQSKTLTHRSITVESKLTSLFLKRNFFLKGASLWQRSSNRKKVSGTVPRIDVRWRRPKKNGEALYQPPNATVSLRNSKARGKSLATSGHVPTGRTSSRQTDPSS